MSKPFISQSYFKIIMCGLLVALSGCNRIVDLPVAKGYSAKFLCSAVFNSGFDEAFIRDEIVAPAMQPLPLFWQTDVNYEEKMVTVGDVFFGTQFAAATAIYREGIGCTLLGNRSIEEVDAQAFVPLDAPPLPSDQPWPQGSGGLYPDVIPGLDTVAVDMAVANAFLGENESRNTTSVVVVYDGKLIAEQYGIGATAQTPMIGFSMTKSVSSTLIGIAQDLDLIDINDPAPITEWQGTAKEMIQTKHILHMAAGLDFIEDYAGWSDVTQMLFAESDQAVYAAARPLVNIPGDVFNYSTGEANLLARIVQDAAGGSLQEAYDFYQTQLFHKIDIRSAFIEFDASGRFVGGAFGHMTARDWARLGQLYIQSGDWFGEQVVSAEWMEFALTPSPAADFYGAQIWLNTDGGEWPELPEDAYHFSGFQGQQVIIIPSQKLVVVWTGMNISRDGTGHYVDEILSIIAALPDSL